MAGDFLPWLGCRVTIVATAINPQRRLQMFIVAIASGSALLGALAYVYVPTDKIQSPTLATVINYGTPVAVGAVIGIIAYAVS